MTHDDLRDAVVLVTGASTGIGAAAALRFAAAGARVGINYLRSDRAAAGVLAAVNAAGGTGILLRADVTQRAQVHAMIDALAARFGGIDCLVNNAGSPVARSTLAELPEATWDEALAVNLKGAFLCSQAAIPHLRRARAGRIVNVSSLVGRTGESSPHYAVAKAGVNALTRALARELAPVGIAVNAVAPGLIDTPVHAKFAADPQAIFARVVPRIPMGRAGTADEVAAWIVFLASADAGYTTGQIIDVNGGQLMA
jgi:3-oxoacyl-[acyl-carrier protein] reductase